MFPMGPVLIATATMLFSTVACVLGFLSAIHLVFLWGGVLISTLALLLMRDQSHGLRRAGAALLGVTVLSVALVLSLPPAHASAAVDLLFHGSGLASDLVSTTGDTIPLIIAPAGDNGFWGALNGWIATGIGSIVAAFVAWAAKEIATHTKIKIRADQEAQIRETLKTGAYAAMHDLEITIDDHWSPAERQKIIDKMVTWGEQRAATQLKKLGLPNFVVSAMASKVLGQLGLSSDSFDATLGAAATFTGNPGETPALDRAAGGNGGN